MKKVLLAIALLMMVTALAACGSAKGGPENTVGAQETVNQGITVNTIGFERVNLEDLSSDVRSAIDENQAEQGYEVITSGEDIYLVVYAGERRTSGYSIEIQSIVDNEGQTEVKVAETVPPEDAMLLQVLTYPLDIVKLESGISGNVTLTFNIVE